jgi:hypothetical protein
MQLGCRQDQGVRYPQRLALGAKVRGLVGHLGIDGQDLGDEVGEEASDAFLIVATEPSAGQYLGVGHRRYEQSIFAEEVADRLARSRL